MVSQSACDGLESLLACPRRLEILRTQASAMKPMTTAKGNLLAAFINSPCARLCLKAGGRAYAGCCSCLLLTADKGVALRLPAMAMTCERPYRITIAAKSIH